MVPCRLLGERHLLPRAGETRRGPRPLRGPEPCGSFGVRFRVVGLSKQQLASSPAESAKRRNPSGTLAAPAPLAPQNWDGEGDSGEGCYSGSWQSPSAADPSLPAPGSDALQLRRRGGVPTQPGGLRVAAAAERLASSAAARNAPSARPAGSGPEDPRRRRRRRRVWGRGGRGARSRGGCGGGGRCGRLRAPRGLGSAAGAFSGSAAGVAAAAAPSSSSQLEKAAGGEEHRVRGGDPEGAPRVASVSGQPRTPRPPRAPSGS